jgi:hypothetical protein
MFHLGGVLSYAEGLRPSARPDVWDGRDIHSLFVKEGFQGVADAELEVRLHALWSGTRAHCDAPAIAPRRPTWIPAFAGMTERVQPSTGRRHEVISQVRAFESP